MMGRGRVLGTIQTLERARLRPSMYFGRVDPTAPPDFLMGFSVAAQVALGMDGNVFPSQGELFFERGWKWRALGVQCVIYQMRRRGMSDEAIVDELIAVEIEMLRRACERVTGKNL